MNLLQLSFWSTSLALLFLEHTFLTATLPFLACMNSKWIHWRVGHISWVLCQLFEILIFFPIYKRMGCGTPALYVLQIKTFCRSSGVMFRLMEVWKSIYQITDWETASTCHLYTHIVFAFIVTDKGQHAVTWRAVDQLWKILMWKWAVSC